MTFHILRFVQLPENPLRKHLAQLDTHLVIRVDSPNGTLDENLVFVHCDQGTKGCGCEQGEKDRVGRLVTGEDFRFNERFGSVRAELVPDLLFCFPKRKCFRLRKKVGQQNTMVIPNRIMRICGCQKVGWNKLSSLMYELVERVLAVCSRCAPNNRSGLIVYGCTGLGYRFSVRFHVALLEVVCEFVEVLVVGE